MLFSLVIRRYPTALLPPANEVCEGYVFTPVCQSFCSWGGGGGIPACLAGLQATPKGEVEGSGRGGVSRPTAGGGGGVSRPDTPQQMATAAGGTYPTGMHPCFHMLPDKMNSSNLVHK